VVYVVRECVVYAVCVCVVYVVRECVGGVGVYLVRVCA
jgi:hypothetical protein